MQVAEAASLLDCISLQQLKTCTQSLANNSLTSGCSQENEGGVSRDEMATALMEVVDGRIPKDRIALRELHNEIAGWPWLDADEDQTEGAGEATANYAGITPTGGFRNMAAHWELVACLMHCTLQWSATFHRPAHGYVPRNKLMTSSDNLYSSCLDDSKHLPLSLATDDGGTTCE